MIKLHPKGKLDFYYRVEIPESATKPWIGFDQLTLLDPLAPRPKPREPASNACCGSDCPNCVWIQYRAACEAFELETCES